MAIEDLKITFSVTVPRVVAEDVEDLRGNIPRSEYLRNIIIDAVQKSKNTKGGINGTFND